MARVSTKISQGKLTPEVPSVPISGAIGALTAEQRAAGQFAETVSVFSAKEGQRIERADQKAQNISGEAAIKAQMLELFDSFDTNPNENDYKPAYEKTVKGLDAILKNTTNANSKRDLGQFIKSNRPNWDSSLRDVTLGRKKTNSYARRDQSIAEISGWDLSDPLELDKAEKRVGAGEDLMITLGHSKEQAENWGIAVLEVIENQSVYNQAQNISQAQGYQVASKWVMEQNIDMAAKRKIVGDIKFDAAQKQLGYDIEVEKIEQGFLEKLRQEALTEDEVMASGLEVDKKQEWLRLIDAQTEERLNGEVPLNPDAYDKLQTMVEDYDKRRIEKDAVRKALSEAAGKDISMTIYRSLRDRLSTIDKPDDIMNRADVKRGMSVLSDLETAEISAAKSDGAGLEEMREIRLAYQKLQDDYEKWVRDKEDVTTKEVQDKTEQMTTIITDERGVLKKLWDWSGTSPWGTRYWLKKIKPEETEVEEDLTEMTEAELEAIIKGE